jgi:hypothetical protein
LDELTRRGYVALIQPIEDCIFCDKLVRKHKVGEMDNRSKEKSKEVEKAGDGRQNEFGKVETYRRPKTYEEEGWGKT